MKRLIIISVFIASICRAQVSSKPADWSAAEIKRTKSKLWSIFFNPTRYINKNTTPNPKKNCGSDCWYECDAFRYNTHLIEFQTVVEFRASLRFSKKININLV